MNSGKCTPKNMRLERRKGVLLMNKSEATILGIIYIGMGSSWYQDTEETEVAFQCAKICKADWGHLFKFKRKQKFGVNIFDISKTNKGWYANDRGVFDQETDKPLPHKKTIFVIV